MTQNTPPFTLVEPVDRKTFWIGGQRHSIIVGGEETAGRYSIAHSTMEVGVGASEHIHGVEAEAFYILKGCFRFVIDGEVKMLAAGTFLHVEPGLPYCFEVTGTDAGEVLVLYAPAGLEHFIEDAGVADQHIGEASQQAADQSLANVEEMKARATGYGLRYTGRGRT